MKLYVNPLSPNCRKVSAVVRHLEISVEEVVLDLFKGEHKQPELMAVNPNGMVPALHDGDVKLWESNAIMAYLAGTSGRDTSLWPKSHARYDILRWQAWQLAHFGPACDTFTGENVVKALSGGKPDVDRLAQAAEKVARFGAVLDDHLKDRLFLTGDTLTLADFSVAASLTYATPAQIPVNDFAHINSWRARMDEVPAWKATAPPKK